MRSDYSDVTKELIKSISTDNDKLFFQNSDSFTLEYDPSFLVLCATFLLGKNDPTIHKQMHIILRDLGKKLSSLNRCSLSLCFGMTGVAYSLLITSSICSVCKKFFYEKFMPYYLSFVKNRLNIFRKKIILHHISEFDYDIINGLSSVLIILSSIPSPKRVSSIIADSLLKLFLKIQRMVFYYALYCHS